MGPKINSINERDEQQVDDNIDEGAKALKGSKSWSENLRLSIKTLLLILATQDWLLSQC